MSDPIAVLVVDDSPDDRRIIERHLTRDPHRRFEVATAPPESAIEAAKLHRPDVLVVDQQMRHTTGVQMIARLRKCGRKQAAFVLLTGVEDPQLLRASGADDYLHKDEITPAQLRRVVVNAQVKAALRSEVAERLRFEERLIAIVGHDLRGPLSAAGMGAAVLRSQVQGEMAERSLGIIDGSLRDAQDIVQRLLDLSRVRTGGYPVQRTTCSSGTVFDAVTAKLAEWHPDHAFELEPPDEAIGQFDSAALRQLVANLVANAVRHGREGAPIRVHGHLDGGQLVLAVSNHGTPIPPEARDRLFLPFEQLGSSDLRGLGLGLYIVRSIAEAHGGTVHVESSDICTTFSARLPLD